MLPVPRVTSLVAEYKVNFNHVQYLKSGTNLLTSEWTFIFYSLDKESTTSKAVAS